LEQLFREYGDRSMGPEPKRIAAFYAEQFIVAGPPGSAVFANDDRFLEWLAQLKAFNQRSGMTSMSVVTLAEPLRLSEKHLLATVTWGARFEKTGDRLIQFTIAYLLETSGDGWKILAYVSA
jgi:hypothetical protein